MTRTIEQIKREITTAFINNETIREAYGISTDNTQTFDELFSKVSIESILFYIIAYSHYILECLFDKHTQDIDDAIANLKPHSLSWYVERCKTFQLGGTLIPGTDQYDTSIQGIEVVDFAAADELNGVVRLKVARRNEEEQRVPLTTAQLTALQSYIAQVKDAGVQIEYFNQPGHLLKLAVEIFYNPKILDSHGTNIISPETGDENNIDLAIRLFIENLPFSGELILAHLVDSLQQIPGVMIPVVRSAQQSIDNVDFQPIDVKYAPPSGYFQYIKDNITITYTPYYGNI